MPYQHRQKLKIKRKEVLYWRRVPCRRLGWD